MHGSHIVIPPSLRQDMLEKLHGGVIQGWNWSLAKLLLDLTKSTLLAIAPHPLILGTKKSLRGFTLCDKFEINFPR